MVCKLSCNLWSPILIDLRLISVRNWILLSEIFNTVITWPIFKWMSKQNDRIPDHVFFYRLLVPSGQKKLLYYIIISKERNSGWRLSFFSQIWSCFAITIAIFELHSRVLFKFAALAITLKTTKLIQIQLSLRINFKISDKKTNNYYLICYPQTKITLFNFFNILQFLTALKVCK